MNRVGMPRIPGVHTRRTGPHTAIHPTHNQRRNGAMVPDHVWEQEEAYLEQVLARIRRELRRLEFVKEQRRDSVLDLRRHFWDEITVNIDNFDETLETLASIQQQKAVLKSQEHGLAHAEKQLRKLEKMADSPYFGRIDFRAEDEARAESIYIGIGSLIDEETGEALVYDWRAPISGLFYDYGVGPAQYETPEGRVAGKIELKRQYEIGKGKLLAVFDTGIHIGDEMLRRMLDRHADDRMKAIVSTIQQEQNRIIRDEAHRVLIVQGSAGSGKTSAALQRIAYLLYRHRKTLDADRVLLFTPNDIFKTYVSSVLPELGESNVPQSTFHEMTVHLLGSDFRVESPYDHLERKLTEAADRLQASGTAANGEPADGPQAGAVPASGSPAGGARIRCPDRSALETAQQIDAYLESLTRSGMRFVPMTAGKRVLVDEETMSRFFYETVGDKPLRARFAAMKEWLAESVRAYRVDAERRIYAKLLKEPKYIGTEEELRLMAGKQAHKRAVKLLKWVRQGRFIDRVGLYVRFLEGDPAAERIAAGEVPYEEAAALLYFLHKLEGKQAFGQIRYVLVDEVQDYSPMQIALIKHLFPRSRMTFLGDLNQSVFGDTGLTDYRTFTDCFGPEDVGLIRLTKSYRSTQDILDFCRRILPEGAEHGEAFGRRGEKPALHRCAAQDEMQAAIAARIARLQQEGMSSIAVICRTERDAREAHERLKERIALRLITRESHQLDVSLPVVIPSYMAKGLEFDAVIVYDGSAATYGGRDDRKLLYAVCTRALHRLDVFFTGEPSPFLPVESAADRLPG
jgi:DNA helicase-2/ATP-dependent DNA helicase PcrA